MPIYLQGIIQNSKEQAQRILDYVIITKVM